MEPEDVDPANVEHMLGAARAAIEAEGRFAERYETKARGQATLAGSWFAATQVIALASAVAHIQKGWIIVLIVGLIAQAACLVVMLEASAQVWRLQAEQDLGTGSLKAMNRDVGLPAREFASKAIDFYCRILDSTRAANKTRAEAFGTAWHWWWPVLGIGLAEVAVALLARL